MKDKTLNTIPVFYCDNMVADSRSYSPSAGKPRHAVANWQHHNMPITVKTPRGVTRAQMYLAHDPLHVDMILDRQKSNGFGNRSAAVAQSLRYTSGAMLSAAKEALRNGRVAAAPCSGFHHAGYDYTGGFCTLNGLMITAMALRHEGFARQVGILDFDQHYGDGTDDIITSQGIDHVVHFTAGKHYHRKVQARDFLEKIPHIVASMAGCDVILYQAGADPHVKDPLGGWLTTKQLKMRDQMVFLAARRHGVPIAWNLAGGYQKPFENVLEIHTNTMKVCAQTFL